ncbi:MAG: PQQ-binding-like beta-propeller repeat protein [Candidatus Sulfotelmatobacter sp.]
MERRGFNGGGSSPAIANGVVYVGSIYYFNGVYALNASTGAELWSFTTGGSNGVSSSPAVANGVVYFGCDDHNVYALNASTGAKLRSFTTGDIVYAPPVVVNGVVYIGSDDYSMYALNASTGAKLWSFTTGAYIWSAPAVANGVVYVASTSTDTNVYALNASTGAKLWSFTTGGGSSSSPAVANGVVYVGSSDNNVYALNASTGTKLWSFNTGEGVYGSPAVSDGVVYVASTNANLYAFGHAWVLKNSSQITENSSSSRHSCAPMNVTAGDLLLSYNIIYYNGSTSGPPTLTNSDTQGNIWTVIQTVTIPKFQATILQIQYARAKSSGSDTIMVSVPSNVENLGNGCEEWSGGATSGPILDGSAGAQSSTRSSVASASATTTGSYDLVVGFCAFPWDSGYNNFAMGAAQATPKTCSTPSCKRLRFSRRRDRATKRRAVRHQDRRPTGRQLWPRSSPVRVVRIRSQVTYATR